MSLNSNVLIPKGVSVADRAAMLGHSIQINLEHYSFAQKDYLDNVKALLDSIPDDNNCGVPKEIPLEPHNIVIFPQKKRSRNVEISTYLDLSRYCGRWDLNPHRHKGTGI